MKFWDKDRDFLNYPIFSQKCLFLGIPRARNIFDFYQNKLNYTQNKYVRFDDQCHLAEVSSTAHEGRQGLRDEDDISSNYEVSNPTSSYIKNKKVIVKGSKGKIDVKSIIDKFDRSNTIVKRSEIKMSPKVKNSPKRCWKLEKAKKVIQRGNSPVVNSPKSKPKLILGHSQYDEKVSSRTPIKTSKVEAIVTAFEMNTKLNEKENPNSDMIDKKKNVVNAFSKLMKIATNLGKRKRG